MTSNSGTIARNVKASAPAHAPDLHPCRPRSHGMKRGGAIDT